MIGEAIDTALTLGWALHGPWRGPGAPEAASCGARAAEGAQRPSGGRTAPQARVVAADTASEAPRGAQVRRWSAPQGIDGGFLAEGAHRASETPSAASAPREAA